jgi:hypothetical protein
VVAGILVGGLFPWFGGDFGLHKIGDFIKFL